MSILGFGSSTDTMAKVATVVFKSGVTGGAGTTAAGTAAATVATVALPALALGCLAYGIYKAVKG